MKSLPCLCLVFALLGSHAARADCPLAFAPPEIRRAASEHYYRSSRRDAPAPGHLPFAARANESECVQDADGEDPARRCIHRADDAAPSEAAREASGD